MKKNIFLTSLIAVLIMSSTTTVFAANNTKDESEKYTQPPFERERPKLYDKNGKELTTRPKPGDKVYDKNGKELKPPCMGKKPPKGPELNLSEDQKNKADKIREESKKKLKPIKREMHNIKNQLWEIKEDDTLTFEQKDSKMKPLFEKMHSLHQKADEIRKNDMNQFESLLTANQKKTLEKFKKTHKPRHNNMNGKRMPPPPMED